MVPNQPFQCNDSQDLDTTIFDTGNCLKMFPNAIQFGVLNMHLNRVFISNVFIQQKQDQQKLLSVFRNGSKC